MDVLKGREIECPQPRLMGLKLFEPQDQRRLGRDLNADGKGIDEEPNDRFDARQVGWPPRDHGPEDHVLAIAMTAQEQRPGPLHKRVERQLVLLGELAQSLGHPRREQ